MLNFSLSSNSTTKSSTDFFRFDVNVVDGEEVCLHLCDQGQKLPEIFQRLLACISFRTSR